jgi:hypothetical protein
VAIGRDGVPRDAKFQGLRRYVSCIEQPSKVASFEMIEGFCVTASLFQTFQNASLTDR